MKLGLRQEGVSEAAHPEKRATLDQSEAYIERFLDFYGRNLPKLAVTEMTMEGKPCNLESLLRLLHSEKKFQVIGPSGTGKTHLIKHLSLQSISAGYAPVFVPAKYFLGRLSELLDRSVVHLHPGNAGQLFKSLLASGRYPFLIIDGVNECPTRHFGSLIETLQAFALRQKFPIIFTSQSELDLPTELLGPIIYFNYLTKEEKLKVASVYLTEPESIIAVMFDALRTPFEIFLVVQTALEAGRHITKYELFNSYSRRCLECGEDSSLAFRILVKVAQIMAERLSTAILLSEFKRIAEAVAESVRAKPDAIATALESGLIEVQHGSFSFSHEMIQRFFEAEAILSGDACAEEMAKPRNYHLADFVLGAQADTESAKKLVRLDAFQNLLLDGFEGHFGKYVGEAIHSDIAELFEKAKRELREIDFVFNPQKGPFGTNLELVGGMKWTSYERALMGTIGRAFMKGFLIDPVLKLVQETDRICFKLLDNKGFPDEMRIRLRNDLFPLLYVWQAEKSLSVSQIFSGISMSRIWFEQGENPELARLTESVFMNLEKQPLGVLYLMCELIRRSERSSAMSQLPRFLRHCWNTGIYHLRLHALEAIQLANTIVNGQLRSEIVDTINALDYGGNVFLSTTILEILSAYDEIEVGVTVDDAFDEIHRLLYPTPESEKEIRQLQALSKEWDDIHQPKLGDKIHEKEVDEVYNLFAYNAWSKILEEVYQGVYYEAIELLEKDELRRFLTMAALGASSYASFVATILKRLLELDDPRTLAAFEKWAAIPDHKPFMIHDAIESFLLGIVGLARYTDNPPLLKRPQRDDEAAWQCYREILFWLHKPSIEDQTVRKNCAPCWQRLLGRFSCAAIDPLMRIQGAIRSGISARLGFYKDPASFSPSEVKDILEAGLEARSELTSLFGDHDYFKKDHGNFMVKMLEEVGNETSISLLENLIESADLGQIAAKAIRTIRARVVS
jgi:DNA replication protein DnaC